MNNKRFYFGMIGLNVLLVSLLVGGVFYGGVLIQKQSDKLANAKGQSKILEEQQLSLTQAKQDLEKYKDLNEVAKSIVPQDKDQAKTVREITKIANESGVELKGIAFQTSNLGQATPAAPANNTAPTAGATGTAPAAPVTPPISQVKPVEGISGVYALEITVTSLETKPISYQNLINFLDRLEKNRRTAHVAKINIKPANNGRDLSFALTLNAYLKP